MPIFEATVYPEKHPEVAKLLSKILHIVGYFIIGLLTLRLQSS